MRVKSCAASDGSGHVINLTDEFGCVLRPKMISRFLKARAPNEKATIITYAFFHAFKFPDALSVHIKCKVEICRHGCLEHCQLSGSVNERKDTLYTINRNEQAGELNESAYFDDNISDNDQDLFYSGLEHNNDDNDDEVGENANNELLMAKLAKTGRIPENISNGGGPSKQSKLMDTKPVSESAETNDQFPYGPRQLEAKDRIGLPAVAGPRSLHLEDLDEMGQSVHKTKNNRRKRTVVSRHLRNADVGVAGIYEVISESDLAFSPDRKQESVTVFQGKISEEIVYGICMPLPGFSILFILITSAAVIATLVAGSLLYRYQLQRDAFSHQIEQINNEMNLNTLTSWMTMRISKKKKCTSNQTKPE